MAEFTKKLLVTLAAIIGIILIPLVAYYVLPHFMPFLIALLFALLLEPVNQLLVTRLKIKRSLAVNLSYFLFLGLTGILIYFVIVKIAAQLFNLVKTIQENIPGIKNWLIYVYTQTQDYIRLLPPELAEQINNTYGSFIDQLTNLNLLTTVGSFTYGIGTVIPNFLIETLLFLISLYLISINLISIRAKFYSFFKPSSKQKLSVVLADLKSATIGFFQAQIIISSITYVLSLGGLLVLGVRYALVIALVIVIVDILPILGTGSVMLPWAAVSFINGNAFLAVGLIALYIVIVLVRRIVEPKILGDRIGLGALSTLISIWVGFNVLGLAGVFAGPLLLILIKALIKAEVITLKIKF